MDFFNANYLDGVGSNEKTGNPLVFLRIAGAQDFLQLIFPKGAPLLFTIYGFGIVAVWLPCSVWREEHF